MNRTIIIAACVFVALFAGVLLLPQEKQMTREASPDTREQTGGLQPLSTRVEGTFQKVKVDPNQTPEQAIALADAQERQTIAVYAKMEGRQPPSEAEMIAANNDAPAHEGYTRYATLAQSGTNIMEAAGQDMSGLKVGCFSTRVDKQTLHIMVLYDEARSIPLEGIDLRTWMFSGCAKAVPSGRELNSTQVMTTMRDLLPKTPEFDAQRQQIASGLTAKPRRS